MSYEVTIGLEIHAELETESKMFCNCGNVPLNSQPNRHICPVCTGQPGSLPVPNRKAIEWTIKTGLALGCKISAISKFDRKNYFYPDLPKGYQISQFDLPFCQNGKLEIDGKEIRVRRLHLEEDTGKLIHPKGADYSLVDYNRSGTPLMELVTEPDLHSAEEAKKFCQMYQLILRYLKVSSADMEKGQMRCEVNISLKKPEDRELGNLVEIKNINSFRSVGRAIEYEIRRQSEILDGGEAVPRENRGWDDNKGITISQRGKEEAHEYRYFPEPDIPPFNFDSAPGSINIEEIEKSLPELPSERLKKFAELGLSEADANDLTFNKSWGDYLEKVMEISNDINPKLAANWIINEGLTVIKEEKAAGLLMLIEKGEISGKIAKDVLSKMKGSDREAQAIIEEFGLIHIKDESAIEEIVKKVIVDNPKAVQDYQSGKEAALKYLVGAIMKETKGQADPGTVTKLLDKNMRE